MIKCMDGSTSAGKSGFLQVAAGFGGRVHLIRVRALNRCTHLFGRGLGHCAVRMGLVRGAVRPVPLLAQGWLQLMLGICCVVLLTTLFRLEVRWEGGEGDATSNPLGDVAAGGHTLVSYSYFEKDNIQRANLEFFMAVGMVS